MNWNIGTLNVRGIRGQIKRLAVFEFLKRSNFDIVFIQESHSTPSDEKVWLNEWGGPIYFSHGTSNAGGVAILMKNKFDIIEVIQPIPGRVVAIQVNFNSTIYAFINLYAPNLDEEQKEFYNSLLDALISPLFAKAEILIGGNFNLVLNPNLDKRGGLQVPRPALQNLNNLISSYLKIPR